MVGLHLGTLNMEISAYWLFFFVFLFKENLYLISFLYITGLVVNYGISNTIVVKVP